MGANSQIIGRKGLQIPGHKWDLSISEIWLSDPTRSQLSNAGVSDQTEIREPQVRNVSEAMVDGNFVFDSPFENIRKFSSFSEEIQREDVEN
jgi:hypothetical protein